MQRALGHAIKIAAKRFPALSIEIRGSASAKCSIEIETDEAHANPVMGKK
jgi:hypothetical protein